MLEVRGRKFFLSFGSDLVRIFLACVSVTQQTEATLISGVEKNNVLNLNLEKKMNLSEEVAFEREQV